MASAVDKPTDAAANCARMTLGGVLNVEKQTAYIKREDMNATCKHLKM